MDSNIPISACRLIAVCSIRRVLVVRSSGNASDGGPQRISSTSAAVGGRLRISDIRARSSSHLGQAKSVCLAVSSGSTQQTQ
ncbi:Uncharacterized protein FWK35_00036610 [Aphis craccivora]|uniref:Uncharacterized protein n=1 Tax=Aphis craccivora TaxID=307492 RepID=A0A6G0VNW8_APHCR|nr:Uncharacterized protein FWK35_00036610 [Aphis craccivora]